MQRAICVICVSAAIFLAAIGPSFGEEDAWLKFTTEGNHSRNQGQYSEAERKYLDAYRLIADDQKSERLAKSLSNLAAISGDLGRYREAENFALRALEVRRQISDPTSSELAVALNNLAEIYRIQEKDTVAEPLYLQLDFIHHAA